MKPNTLKAVLVALGAVTVTSLGMSIRANRKLSAYKSSVDKMSAAADKLESITKEFGPKGSTSEDTSEKKKN